MAYVYIHTRIDNNEVFYVGIGDKKNFSRAYVKCRRSKEWHSIASIGYSVTIIEPELSWDAAQLKEKELISVYGRIDLGTGTLVNKTSGGQGTTGALVSELTRLKITKAKTGKKRPPISESARKNLSNAMKGRKPKNFHLLHTQYNTKRVAGLKNSFSTSTIEGRSARWTGADNPNSTEVINIDSGIFYENLKEAFQASGLKISRSFFSMMLLGKRNNYTQFRSLKTYSITHKY